MLWNLEISTIMYGIFVIVNESDGTNDKDQKWVDMIDGMSMYTEQ